jgi:transmembrane sensor
MTTVKDARIAEAIEERATEWFVRHRENVLTPAEQQAYLGWLRASPQHVQAYLNLIAMAAKLPRAIAGLGIDAEALAREISQAPQEAQKALFVRPSAAAPQRHPSRPMRRYAVVASLLLGLLAGAFWMAQRWLAPPSFVVADGQNRVMTLADGSIAHLNSNTRIVVRFSDAQRLIELPEGQALFSVTHDARRPFIVRSGSMDVVAIGTRFDVLRRGSQTQVTVVEGRIEIVADKPAPPLRLGAGEQVRFVDGAQALKPRSADIKLATAWARKEVAFSAERLEDIAAQFSQYTGAQISIEDERLRDYRISGVFQAYDLESFLQYFKQFDGVTVERDGDRVQVRSKAR